MPMRMPMTMTMPREPTAKPSEPTKPASAPSATLHLGEHFSEVHVHAAAHHIVHAGTVIGAVFVSA